MPPIYLPEKSRINKENFNFSNKSKHNSPQNYENFSHLENSNGFNNKNNTNDEMSNLMNKENQQMDGVSMRSRLQNQVFFLFIHWSNIFVNF